MALEEDKYRRPTQKQYEMNKKIMENARSFFSGEYLIKVEDVLNNLKFGQTIYTHPEFEDEWVDIPDGIMRNAIENRFENFEFALDEKGNPDGLKNHQEMVLTIADDIANKIQEIAYKKAQKELEKYDYLDTYANQLFEDSKGD